jgi:hypothetical protein
MPLLHACGRGFPAVHLSCDEVVRLFGIGGTTACAAELAVSVLFVLNSRSDTASLPSTMASIREVIEYLFVLHRIQCKYLSIRTVRQQYNCIHLRASVHPGIVPSLIVPFLKQSLKFA